jgi:c-di-GMP-binding flagellar brake protein YcgR
MFALTKTFWRRLVGRPSASANGTVQTDDRRVWVRYPADLQTACKPAGAPDSTRLSARVRNISLGGINLLGSRAFKPGELLTVELPGADEESRCNVLACVVHCAEDEGGWSIGCTFSRDLSDADLSSFGARRERNGVHDQRQWKRFDCSVTATYQFVAAPDGENHDAKVLNVSVNGVGLVVDRDIENGTLLSVELHNAAGTTQRTMLACVVHVTRQGVTEWALGCNFIRSLSEEDVKAFS